MLRHRVGSSIPLAGFTFELKDGQNRYLMQPDPSQTGKYTLLGLPASITTAMPTTKIVLADMSQVAVARDVDMSGRCFDQTFAATDELAIRVVSRWTWATECGRRGRVDRNVSNAGTTSELAPYLADKITDDAESQTFAARSLSKSPPKRSLYRAFDESTRTVHARCPEP